MTSNNDIQWNLCLNLNDLFKKMILKEINELIQASTQYVIIG